MAVQEWRERAMCIGLDPEAFYFDNPDRDSDNISTVVEVCRACPVVRECLTYALERRERFGIWGGATSSERDKMIAEVRRQRATIPQVVTRKLVLLQKKRRKNA